ncbi:uncharacterized protein EAE98_012172 [Botrytis deweyae]|uniref:Uncharacterized protein n=2 Tax=Botrytis TaxID=33196 RepID=A0A4Z1JT25_9HELO|nr:uncharacterized protein EAE98_012172 [Botrytis deweyae]KAF7910217.1 hypothetical protein EAE98_012172 [Botrytis deweyae]KAF7934579.1 hypothetical protein EAE99_003029 [Botrytis elliptica]TGO76636.1 hypothetical protein BELL_0145g00140 [Botrytis elliptica]
MPAGHSAKTHHCPGMKTMMGNCRMDGRAPNTRLKYCLTHQYYCPVCAASPGNKDYVMLCASDICTGGCGYKHRDHKDNVKARQDAEKKAKEAAVKAKAEDGKAKVAAQKAAAAARKSGR